MSNSLSTTVFLVSLTLATLPLLGDEPECPMQGDSPNGDDFVVQTVPYSFGDTDFEGRLIFETNLEPNDGDYERIPGILMVPNWMGPGDSAVDKAMRIAEEFEAVVFVVDMYGTKVRPTNSQEASQAAGFVRGDRQLMRDRANKALAIFRELALEAPFDAEDVTAIGFCFGGGTVLELARSGAEIDAVISFHGDLVSPMSGMEQAVAKILVLHGAADPYVPQEDVAMLVNELQEADIGTQWSLIQYGGAVHSFTDPLATAQGAAEYNALVSGRAFEAMDSLLEEVYGEG